MKTKICCTCKARKKVSEFYADKHRPDGLYSRCKTCHYACTHHNQKRYRSTPHGKAVFKRINAKAYINHRDKILARASVRYHTKKGNIPYARDLLCVWCGKQASDYHHHNGYSKEHKRDVIPLCKTCYGLTRRKD